MIVDHIVGRDSLETDEFERADIAPWIPGEPEPNPDDFVNVQDLSLLQNIILTGVYPNGVEINGCSFTSFPKMNGVDEYKVTFYIYDEGITAYINSTVDIRAAQIEFGGEPGVPNNMTINTGLGQGYFIKRMDYLEFCFMTGRGLK